MGTRPCELFHPVQCHVRSHIPTGILCFFPLTIPSAVDVAKRELVKLLRALAAKYKLKLDVSRESSVQDVCKAFKNVSLRVHPDKGGELTDFQNLSAANDAWQDLLKSKAAWGRPRAEPAAQHRATVQVGAVAGRTQQKEYRVDSEAVLLTYQGFPADSIAFFGVWNSAASRCVAQHLARRGAFPLAPRGISI